MSETLQTGRYESHVTPSNYLGEGGVHADSPTLGVPVDFEHDDPADVEDAIKSVGSSDERQTSITGVSPREQREIDKFESAQDQMRAEYQELVASGVSSEDARREVAARHN